MGKEQRAVRSGDPVVEVEATVWLKLGLSPSGVEGADIGRGGAGCGRGSSLGEGEQGLLAKPHGGQGPHIQVWSGHTHHCDKW